MASFSRICVYCGASPGSHPAYLEAARATGRLLAQEGIGLVYGGARIGLMGAVADAALAAGGEVIGIIPEHLQNIEVGHNGLTELRVVPDMHARKAAMAEAADGFITLPGGIGTLEEVFEVFTWAQLGLHAKPLGMLNVRGYYDPLSNFLDRSVAEGFLMSQHRQILLLEQTPQSLLARMEDFAPVEPISQIDPDALEADGGEDPLRNRY